MARHGGSRHAVNAMDVVNVADMSALHPYRRSHNDELRRLVAPTLVHTVGVTSRVPIHAGILDVPEVSLTLENGEPYRGDLSFDDTTHAQIEQLGSDFVATHRILIPADVPMGYHTLRVRAGKRTARATLICAPERAATPSWLAGLAKNFNGTESDFVSIGPEAKPWGWSFDLDALRSSSSWGIGDYEDLRTVVLRARTAGNPDFLAPGPLDAGEPVSPLSSSPHSPVSRFMLDFSAIRPETIEEYGLLDQSGRGRVAELFDRTEPLDGDAQLLDRDAMWSGKKRALWLIFQAGRNSERQRGFNRFKAERGELLDQYATWCLCADQWGVPSPHDANAWTVLHTAGSDEVRALCERYPQALEFYRWLEWIAFDQLGGAAQTARSVGMRLGLVAELTDAVRPAGAEVWGMPEAYVTGVRCGDGVPMNPLYLEATGYKLWRDLIHTRFSCCGAIHIADAAGLLRQRWVPLPASGNSEVAAGNGDRTVEPGAVVVMDAEAKLAVLKIEATRAGGLIICGRSGDVRSEDDEVFEVLADCGFVIERQGVGIADGSISNNGSADGRAPRLSSRAISIAAPTPADAEPLAGRLHYDALTMQEQLESRGGERSDSALQARRRSDAVTCHNAVLTSLIEAGFLDPRLVSDEFANEQQLVEACYRAVAADRTTAMVVVSLVDAVGQRRSPYIPKARGLYPNWQVPLVDGSDNVVSLDTLFDRPRLRSLVQRARLR